MSGQWYEGARDEGRHARLDQPVRQPPFIELDTDGHRPGRGRQGNCGTTFCMKSAAIQGEYGFTDPKEVARGCLQTLKSCATDTALDGVSEFMG